MKNKRTTKLLDDLVPKRTRMWLISAFLLNFAVYYGTRLLFPNRVYHMVSTGLDKMIPLVPEMVVVYVLAYAFWGVNYIIITRESPEKCREVMTGEYIAKIICLAVFLFYPTETEPIKVTGDDVFSSLLRLLLAADEPNNLMPSIHCLESWLCWRGLFGCQKVGHGYKTFSLLFALAVFASTLLVHQHLLVDLPTAVLVGEIGLWASKLLWKKTLKA